MHVRMLYTRAFRNLSEQEVFFGKGVTLVYGKTGHGKTSLIEALSLLIVGASFRTHLLREAISFGHSSFFLEATVSSSGVDRSLGLGYDGTKRYVTINQKTVASTKELIGCLLGVTSGLSDSELLTQAPSLRRRYLDEQIAEIDAYFVDQLTKANRALQQRNMLLKTGQMKTIEVWEEILASSAMYVIQQRRTTTEALIPLIFSWLERIPAIASIRKELDIRFRTQMPLDGDGIDWLRKQLEAKRDKEKETKTTLVGHHRDDLLFFYKNAPLKQTLSLGQLRLVALAIRLAEWSLLRDRALGEEPIFLLDDIDGMLDGEAQEQVFRILPQLGQVILTSHDHSLCHEKKCSEVSCVVSEGNIQKSLL